MNPTRKVDIQPYSLISYIPGLPFPETYLLLLDQGDGIDPEASNNLLLASAFPA
jgi:hypothetical protein